MAAASPDPTLEGGVMPAERAGLSSGPQGKAIPVDRTAWQLRLPIATADDSQGAKRRASLDRSGVREVMVPKAIVNAESVTPVTMEEVAYPLTAALLKVVSNKGGWWPTRRSRRSALAAAACCWRRTPISRGWRRAPSAGPRRACRAAVVESAAHGAGPLR